MAIKTLVAIVVLVLIIPSVYSQKKSSVDTIKFSSKPQIIFIPGINNPETSSREDEIKMQNDSLKKLLSRYIEVMQNEKIISDNVVVSVDAEIINENNVPALKVTYSYSLKNDTLKYQTDDFRPGKYAIHESNAMKVTLDIMKQNIDKQFSKYISDNKEISFNITGSADAVKIKGNISYNGEYGNPVSAPCAVEGKLQPMTISSQEGIKTNEELAFIRSFTVRDFISNEIPALKDTKNNYSHVAQVSQDTGGQHRRVSIVMVIHNAFEEKELKSEQR